MKTFKCDSCGGISYSSADVESHRNPNCPYCAATELRESEDIMKKLYKCNDDGVAEWCVATSKMSAYVFMSKIWGEGTMKDYEDEYLDDNKGSTTGDFIENFFIEEEPERDFTIIDAGPKGEPVTKKVSEWLKDVTVVPSYFCCENY